MRKGYYRKNKYGSSSCSCISNHKHHSRAEATYCTDLFYLKKAGEIKDFETQHKIDIRINGVHIRNYFADFLITHNDGTQEIVEVKGYEGEVGMMKYEISKALYETEQLKFTMKKV